MKKSTALLRFIIVEVVLFVVIVFLMSIFIFMVGRLTLQTCIKGDESYYGRVGWTEEATKLYDLSIATQEKIAEENPVLKWVEDIGHDILITDFIIVMAIGTLMIALFSLFYKYTTNFKRTYRKRYSKT